MALFKILKGSSANLSSQKIREGYCYVTTDEGKMYIDVSDTERICLNAGDSPHADKADTADKLTYKRLINGVEFDGSSDIYFYGTCSTAAGTAAKTVTLQSGSTFLLKTGATVIVKFTNKNSASSPTLNINGTGAKPIYRYGTTAASTSDGTSGWRAGSVHMFTYDGTGWIRHFWENTNTVPSGYCTTAADTAAKAATCTDYALKTNSYLHLIIKTANTSKTALTLNVNGKGAKPIYINGAASSTSNYTLPAGSYIAFYDGTNYYIRTDGKLPGTIEKADKANNLNNLSIGTNQRPVYFNGGVPTQTTYRMAGTNAAATTALSIASDLPTGIWYVNGTNTDGQKVSDFNQADGVVIANQYSDKWITEIYQDYRTGQLAVRGKNNGTWQAWRKVLDDTNYTSYTVKKDGTGASGTWGISISGNAATATNATNANYATTAGSAGSAGKLSESVSVGGATKPVYFSKGTPTACTTPTSGAYFSSLPVIGSDGVMEIGRYIDFHYTTGSTNNYDVRIDSAGANKNTIYLPGVTGQVVVHTNDTKIGGSDTPVYIAATGVATAASKYAGGTQVTLNGTSKSASTASFYAPTGAGTAGYILKSNGSGKAPTWDTIGNLMNSTFVNVTGDTMTGNLEVTNTDNSVILNTGGTITHQVTATGGWARGSSWQHKNGDTITALGVAGLYGAGTTVSYYYIGNAYNDVWMKVTPGGHVTATKFIGDLQGAASRLSTSAGSTSQPVYFSGGVPVGITAVGAAYGGTGKTTLVDSANVLLNALSTGASVPSDNDYFISQYVNGGTTTTTYHRRPVSKLYEYIKGKAEGTWGISISGNAATATHANTAGSAGSAGYADYLPTSITFTPAESAITPDGVYDLIGAGGRIKRGSWSYTNNGYIAKGSTATTKCPFGAIDLAGTTVIQAGNAKTQYTQIYITPPTASTTDAIKGEMLYYINNGDGYSPTWYRVLTNKNYNNYTVKKDGTGATGTWGISISGNAATASKLSGTRTITLTGDVTGAGSSDGSTGWSIEATVKDDSHNHIISNVDGLQTTLDNKVSQGASSLEMNSGGSLAKYGGFIDFHYHNADKKPTDASGAIVDKTPDYTSRIIEDAPGILKVNGVAFQGGNITGTLKGTADKANNLGNYTIGGATQPVYFNGGVPTVVTAVGTAYGGTGNTTYTAGRVIYASAADKLSSSNLSMSGYEATMTATSTAGVRFKAVNSNGGVSLLASTNRGMYDDTNSKWIVYTNTAGDQTYVINWKSKGSSDTPVYFNSSGAAVAASKYAGGTQVTLNNVSKSASTASFYAPTGAGTAGQVLKSSGSGKAPVWANISDLMDGRFVNASGDTMTGDLTLTGEKATIYKIERKKASGGGWAYAPMRFIGNDNAVFANIGAYGGDNALTYMYIGAGDYNSDINLRISATGAVTAKSFVGPLTGNATSATTATKDSSGAVIKDTYVKKAGDTMTGALNTSHQSSTWINSANGKSAINLTGTGYTGWISGNAKDGRLVISSYPNSTNLLYFGYMSNERIAAGTNSFEQSMTWDGSTNTLTATTFKGTLDGNAKTATNATNATNAGHATTAGSAGSATYATYLTNIDSNDTASKTDTWRRLWFCYDNNTTGRPAQDDRFAIQTSTGTLKAPIFSGTLSGAIKDYNDGKLVKFGYSTAGIAQSAAVWIGAWDATVSGEYRLRAVKQADLRVAYAASASSATTATKARLTEVILNDSSNWKLGVQWRNTTLEAGTYLAGIGRHNTGGNSTNPGTISIIPYATDTSPWGGTVGLFISKDTITFENQTIIHSGNHSSYDKYNTPKYTAGLQIGTGTNVASLYVPNATSSQSGVVTTGAQTFAGTKTFSGQVVISNTTDAAKGSASGAFRIGAISGEHLAMDGNEIMAKSNATTASTLYLNSEGGNVQIGGPTSIISTLSVSSTGTFSGEVRSTSANAFRMVQGNYGVFLRNDGSDTYFLITASGDQYGNWNGLRPFYFNNASGNVTIGHNLTVGGTIYGNLSGNATTSYYPYGFTSYSTNATWGNQTGTTVVCWNEANGGSVDWRRDNPSSGKISLKVDGRFYGNEGSKPAMLMTSANGYWGLSDPDGTDSAWIRTTSLGIIPYQSGVRGSGHQSLGTSSWYFSAAYIDTVDTSTVYATNWFRSYNETGWYNETYKCHVMPFTGSYGGVRITGNSRGNYDGLIIGDSSGITLMSSTDRAHHGLYHQEKEQWAFYYNKNNKYASVLGANINATGFPFTVYGASYIDGRLVVKGNGSSYNEGIRILPASNGWSNIFFSANTTTEGTMDGGWLIGRRGAAGGTYGAAGDFCIENNNSAGVNLTLTKSGVLCNIGPILGYRYKQGNAKPAFVWDKPGSHFTGVGANGSSNTIQFGPVNSTTFEWEPNFHQHWRFIGSVSADSVISTPAVTGGMWIQGSHEGAFRVTSATNASAGGYYQAWFSGKTPNGAWGMGPLAGSNDLYFVYGSDANYNAGTNDTRSVRFSSDGKVWGAVWNDYAEFRTCVTTFEAGQVVCENGDDTLSLSTERLQPGACIVSDTFGFAIGETDIADCPIAVSGRVLAYPYEDRNSYKAGDPVCAGPNGTVSKMTREEVREYPDRMIGTVSAIPKYETWGQENIPVNGRIWIKVV